MADFELVYEVRIPVERESYPEARVLAHECLHDLRAEIEHGEPDGPRVIFHRIESREGLPACTCIAPRDLYGQYHTLDCAISKQAQERRGKML